MEEKIYNHDDEYFCGIDAVYESIFERHNFESEDAIPDRFLYPYYECERQPIYELTSELLFELISDHFEENSSEDGDEWSKLLPLLEANVNFEAINEAAPKLWSPTGKAKWIRKADIVEYLKHRSVRA